MSDVTNATIPEIKEIIKYKFRLLLKGIKVRPIMLIGHRGIGKTQLNQEVAKELSEELKKHVQCKRMDLLFKERPDFSGMMYVQDGKTMTAPPDIFPTDDESYGIFFMDEANRVVDQGVRSGLLHFIEEREIGNQKLGKNWLVILNGNPGEGDTTDGGATYEVQEMDSAFMDRVARIYVMGDIQALFNHLKKKHGDHPMMDFLHNNPDFVKFDGTGVSPRCFESVLHETPNWHDIDEKVRRMILSAHFGIQGGAYVEAWFKKNDAPRFDDIKNGEEKAFDFIMKNQTRVDVISTLNRAMVLFLAEKHKSKVKLTASEKKNLNQYFDIISLEHKCSMLIQVNKTAQEMSSWFASEFCFGKPYFEQLNKAVTSNRNSA